MKIAIQSKRKQLVYEEILKISTNSGKLTFQTRGKNMLHFRMHRVVQLQTKQAINNESQNMISKESTSAISYVLRTTWQLHIGGKQFKIRTK